MVNIEANFKSEFKSEDAGFDWRTLPSYNKTELRPAKLETKPEVKEALGVYTKSGKKTRKRFGWGHASRRRNRERRLAQRQTQRNDWDKGFLDTVLTNLPGFSNKEARKELLRLSRDSTIGRLEFTQLLGSILDHQNDGPAMLHIEQWKKKVVSKKKDLSTHVKDEGTYSAGSVQKSNTSAGAPVLPAGGQSD